MQSSKNQKSKSKKKKNPPSQPKAAPSQKKQKNKPKEKQRPKSGPSRNRRYVHPAIAKFTDLSVQDAATSFLLPTSSKHVMLDSSRSGGVTSLVTTKLQGSVDIDMRAIYDLINGSSTRPEVNTRQGEAVALFPPGSVPIVHFHDPSCPYMMPNQSPTNPTLGNPREWVFPFSSEPIERLVTTTTAEYKMPLVPLGLPTATGATAYMLATEFRRRPVARMRSSTNQQEYVWLDSFSNQPSTYAATVNLLFLSTQVMGDTTFQAYLQAVVLGSDNEEVSSDSPPVSGAPTATSVPNQYSLTLQLVDLVSTSGWYRFEVVLTNPTATPGLIFTDFNLSGEMNHKEYSRIGSGFRIDSTYQELAAIGRRYWMGGSSLLCSHRSPPLTTAGSVYGVNLTSFFNFQDALSLGDAGVRDRAPVPEMANGTQGYDLRDGLFVWEKQRVAPASLLDTALEPPNVLPTALADRPGVSYLINVSGGFDGGSVLYFDPSATATGSTVIMRFQHTANVAYQPRSKLIASGESNVIHLLPDDIAALQIVLCGLSNFSKNDWHDFFTKAANIAAKVAHYVTNAAEAATGNASAVANLSKMAKSDFKWLTGDSPSLDNMPGRIL